jgi:hypothetical protein
VTDAEEHLRERLAIRVVEAGMTPDEAARAEGVACPAWLRGASGAPGAAPATTGPPRLR